MEDGGTSPNPTYPGLTKRWHLVAAVEVVSVFSAVLVTACFTIGNRVWPRETGCLYMPERVLPGSITPDWVCLIFNNRTPLEKHK